MIANGALLGVASAANQWPSAALPGRTFYVTLVLQSFVEVCTMQNSRNTFWEDLARDLEDPDFLKEYVTQTARIATVDRVVNELDDHREAQGFSKADLARAIQVEPAALRRLFSSGQANPTLGTLAEVAGALGLRITLEPLPAAERRVITAPLTGDGPRNTATLAKDLVAMRNATRPRSNT